MNGMDPKVQVQVDPNEDTEWNDILRSHGIIPEKPPSPTQQLEEALDDAIVKQHNNRLENKTMDELDELEDEEDEDFLQFYKQKRLNELKDLQERNKSKNFGDIFPINKSEYEQEVTNASNENFVICHLTLQSNLQSRLLSSILQQLAKKFIDIKFCEIPAQRCIENYPESNCPTLIIYHKTNVLKQFITLTQLGGNSTTVQDIEQVLIDVGAVDHNDKRLVINNEDEEEKYQQRKLKFAKKSIRDDDNNDDDDNDDDFYD